MVGLRDVAVSVAGGLLVLLVQWLMGIIFNGSGGKRKNGTKPQTRHRMPQYVVVSIVVAVIIYACAWLIWQPPKPWVSMSLTNVNVVYERFEGFTVSGHFYRLDKPRIYVLARQAGPISRPRDSVIVAEAASLDVTNQAWDAKVWLPNNVQPNETYELSAAMTKRAHHVGDKLTTGDLRSGSCVVTPVARITIEEVR